MWITFASIFFTFFLVENHTDLRHNLPTEREVVAWLYCLIAICLKSELTPLSRTMTVTL